MDSRFRGNAAKHLGDPVENKQKPILRCAQNDSRRANDDMAHRFFGKRLMPSLPGVGPPGFLDFWVPGFLKFLMGRQARRMR